MIMNRLRQTHIQLADLSSSSSSRLQAILSSICLLAQGLHYRDDPNYCGTLLWFWIRAVTSCLPELPACKASMLTTTSQDTRVSLGWALNLLAYSIYEKGIGRLRETEWWYVHYLQNLFLVVVYLRGKLSCCGRKNSQNELSSDLYTYICLLVSTYTWCFCQCCLMISGLRKDIRCHEGRSLLIKLQSRCTRPDQIQDTQTEYKTSKQGRLSTWVTADDHFNLLQGLLFIYGTL